MWGMCWSTWRPETLDSLGAGVTGACKLLGMGCWYSNRVCELWAPLWITAYSSIWLHCWAPEFISCFLCTSKELEGLRTSVWKVKKMMVNLQKRAGNKRKNKTQNTQKRRKDTVEGECGKCSGKNSQLCKAVPMQWRWKHSGPHLLSVWSYCWPRQEAVIKDMSY